MATRHNLKHSIYTILKHNRDGSCSTQASRKHRLLLMADQWVNAGYQLNHVQQLKTKHINYLVKRWLAQELAASTIKNRMSDLRWLAEKLGRPSLVAIKNCDLAIPKRSFNTQQDKSIHLSVEQLANIDEPDVKLSVLLQQAFGLRREESIKIQINQAVVNDYIELKGSWCKNGRPRRIPILTTQQREVVALCQAHVGHTARALIPADKTYYQQLKHYENTLAKAGIHRCHGLRHAYAQQRYQALTGWPCPKKGGPTKAAMSMAQQAMDRQARQQISEELGHHRIAILSVYI
ncbi:MAG: integrase [Gammaproteobacteria bacterium]|nr:integrase [Gammaproteobacteria bacterium]